MATPQTLQNPTSQKQQFESIFEEVNDKDEKCRIFDGTFWSYPDFRFGKHDLVLYTHRRKKHSYFPKSMFDTIGYDILAIFSYLSNEKMRRAEWLSFVEPVKINLTFPSSRIQLIISIYRHSGAIMTTCTIPLPIQDELWKFYNYFDKLIIENIIDAVSRKIMLKFPSQEACTSFIHLIQQASSFSRFHNENIIKESVEPNFSVSTQSHACVDGYPDEESLDESTTASISEEFGDKPSSCLSNLFSDKFDTCEKNSNIFESRNNACEYNMDVDSPSETSPDLFDEILRSSMQPDSNSIFPPNLVQSNKISGFDNYDIENYVYSVCDPKVFKKEPIIKVHQESHEPDFSLFENTMSAIWENWEVLEPADRLLFGSEP